MIVGVEVGSVVVADPAYDDPVDEGRPAQTYQAVPHTAGCRRAIGSPSTDIVVLPPSASRNAQGGDVHHDAAEQIAPADMSVDVERDGFVFGLLERMPQEQRPNLGHVEHRSPLLAREEGLGERRRVVLERSGDREVRPLALDPLSERQAQPDQLLDALGRVAHLGEPVVERTMLTSVRRLLADEALHLAAQ